MPWVKFDDQFNNHPKVLEAGPLAVALHMRALIYCGQYLTDGVVRPKQLPKIFDLADDSMDFGIRGDAPDTAELASRLVNSGLWSEADDGEGWQIHLCGQSRGHAAFTGDIPIDLIATWRQWGKFDIQLIRILRYQFGMDVSINIKIRFTHKKHVHHLAVIWNQR